MNDHAITAKAAAYLPEQRVRSRQVSMHILLASLVGDSIAVFLGLAFSSWLRFETGLAHLGTGADLIPWTAYFGHVAFGGILFLILLPHREFYDLHCLLHPRQTARLIISTALSWLVLYSTFSWFLRFDQNISRIFVVIAFAVTTVGFILWRILWYLAVSGETIAAQLRRRILFVGWSRPAMALARAILADRRHTCEIAGYVPFHPRVEADESAVLVRRVADQADLTEVLRSREIDTVILADPETAADETVGLANLCEKEMVEFKVLPSGFQILQSCLRPQTVSGVPVLGVSRLPLEDPGMAVLKRAVDVVGGLVGFALSAPLIVLFGVLVHRESPGPIIYRQRRMGRDGRPFWILKIRSMRMDAEREGRVGWTVQDDPRRLRIGAFMRRWNIDELPQFWNVIKGEMSLVGPRPERPELIEIFKEEIPHYNARHSIKPGLTGWAQVNGFRGDTDLTERVRCDLFYIENWSLLLDLQILFMTFCTHDNAA